MKRKAKMLNCFSFLFFLFFFQDRRWCGCKWILSSVCIWNNQIKWRQTCTISQCLYWRQFYLSRKAFTDQSSLFVPCQLSIWSWFCLEYLECTNHCLHNIATLWWVKLLLIGVYAFHLVLWIQFSSFLW